MDSQRWKQVDEVLQSALDRPPLDRDTFLRQACAGDEALEREVRSLLTSDEQAGSSFLENPAIEVAAWAIALEQKQETLDISGSLTGQTVSHYRILEKLGQGGMGVVWKARDTRLDRFVALKFLPAAKMTDPERKRRFVQEARSASALNHPNIVTIYDIDQADGADFIAMEFLPGKTLDHLIPRQGLRLNEALQYAIQVADALAAHTAGIVHRDLKPGNVMVNENGSAKVVDFGLAKLTEQSGFTDAGISEAPKTNEGVIVGTVSYMSPEQAAGKKVDARTDIFSFGAMLYEIVTGQRAFVGDSTASVLSAILRDEPKPTGEIAHNIPRELDRIVKRCLQKDPSRRYQHAGDLKIDLEQVKEELAAVREAATRTARARRWWWLAAIGACAAVSFTIGVRLKPPDAPTPPWYLTRLTNDTGLSSSPALSPDGKFVAYSSDRGLNSERDLYIKQAAGGEPVRLTFDGADNTSPDFSPDGSKIVFRSNRDGGGIYEMPAFGGEARLLAREGVEPKFSPAGSLVAYWIGSASVVASVPGSGSVWVAPVAGGQPRQVAANFTTARQPIWSPDGKRLLFIGYTSAKAFETAGIDWWLASPSGGEVVKTGAFDALVRSGLQIRDPSYPATLPKPACWTANNTVVFSLATGGAENLWEMSISPKTGKVNGAVKRVTTGAGDEITPACAAGGALTFTNAETRREVWAIPFDLNRGTPKGTLERITSGPAMREHASLASNGRYVAFASDQTGRTNIWMRDLETGKESRVAGTSFAERYPVINASGTRVAYSVYEKDKRIVYVSTPGATPERLCEGCLRATDWSRDEKTLLMFGGNPYQVNLLDLASHQQTPLVKHPTYNLLYARYSADNRWISFTVRMQPNRGRIVIAPIDGPKPVPESAWITIAESGVDQWASWSPDGQTLYFPSWRDGHSCFWGQRLDATSHRPVGEPFAALHLHGRVSYRLQRGWSAAAGRIAMVLVEDTGNIWMMSRYTAQ